MAQAIREDRDVQGLRTQLVQAQELFDRQRSRMDDLQFELAEATVARDKALYYLLRFCEGAEREQWPMSDDVRQLIEPASILLFEHNIYTNLPEPDHAILRLMEIVAPDLEGQSSEDM